MNTKQPLTNQQKAERRYAALNAIAHALGFDSWRKFETAVKRGEIIITLTRPAPRPAETTQE